MNQNHGNNQPNNNYEAGFGRNLSNYAGASDPRVFSDLRFAQTNWHTEGNRRAEQENRRFRKSDKENYNSGQNR